VRRVRCRRTGVGVVTGVALACSLTLSLALTACGPRSHATAGGTTASAGPTAPSATPTTSPSPTAAPSTTKPVVAKPPRTTASTVGTGHFAVVPGTVAAPGSGRLRTVKVEIEGGVAVDPAAFATFVMATLNDPRGWGHGGTLTFARTDGSAQIIVRLASPVTSAALCRPLVTFGTLSCSEGEYANLTSYRWFNGQSEFYSLTQYRQYVVNHEVGHVLGHGHLHCAGAGRLAPLMMQQTKRVAPCKPNAWPFP
jgi:hypothetical protein